MVGQYAIPTMKYTIDKIGKYTKLNVHIEADIRVMRYRITMHHVQLNSHKKAPSYSLLSFMYHVSP